MKQKHFTILFIIILFLELLACTISDFESIRYVTKPALTISLLAYLFTQKGMNPRMKKLITLGLFFSLLGDILLMFTEKNQLYFMLGLFSFLIAHIMYISAFFKKSLLRPKALVLYGFLSIVYASIILYYIGPNLGPLMPYVLLYITVILVLGLVALLRKPVVNRTSYLLLLIGALLFIGSDSLLSINKFYWHFSHSSVFIMLTYGLAQLLIVYAAIAEKEE